MSRTVGGSESSIGPPGQRKDTAAPKRRVGAPSGDLVGGSWGGDGKEGGGDEDEDAGGGGWEGPACCAEGLVLEGDGWCSGHDFEGGAVLPGVLDDLSWVALWDGLALEFGVVLACEERLA